MTKFEHGPARVHRDVELAQLGHQLAFVELPWRHLAHDSGEEDKACEHD